MTRSDVVTAARGWIDTPFVHAQRVKGAGVDCAGLIVGVARELGLVAPDFDLPAYEKAPDGTMIEWCDRYMTRVPQDAMQPGDVVVVVIDELPQHLGIVGDYQHGGLSIIHASNDPRHMRVLESRLVFWRRMRFIGAYSLPSVS